MRRLLDTNQLIAYWRRRLGEGDGLPDEPTAATWGRDLAVAVGADGTVSPVYLEFVGHAVTGEELRAYRAFLTAFTVLDGWQITPDDLARARRLAERVPRRRRDRPAKPRGAMDCLIRALADRLGCDVLTADTGLPR